MADPEQKRKNARTALILATIVLVFFLGFIARKLFLG